jgi:CIC family chloride channel protein
MPNGIPRIPRLPRLPTLHDLATIARLLDFRSVSRWVGLGLLVGLVAGLGAAAFFVGMDYVRQVTLHGWANLQSLEPAGERSLFPVEPDGPVRWWLVLLVPALGGLISGILVFRFAPEAEGHGTDSLIEAFHEKRGIIRRRIPIIKGLASVVLIGTGGSAGREGPIAQIGAGFGSFTARVLKLSPRERRLLLLAGAAGGISAIFRTPLGAALFVVEVLYRDDFELDGLVPAVLSSVAAYSVFTFIFGQGAMFATEASYTFHPQQLPLYLLMAVGASLIGLLYIKVFYGTRDRVFHKLDIPKPLKPMIGGLLVGAMALAVPRLGLGAGYGWVQEALLPSNGVLQLGWIGALTMLGIALAKVLTTSLSISSGGSGGVFGPSVVIGGMVGGAFGLAFHELFPNVVSQPGAFVIVGMACFFGGVAHVPISSLVMASEMTGGYDLLVPLMLAEAVTFVLLRRWTLYEKQVPTRRDSKAHGGEYVLDLLQQIRVRDVMSPDRSVATVRASTPLEPLLRQASESSQAVFPVASDQGEMVGIVTIDTLRGAFFHEDLGQLAIAADCAMPFVSVLLDDTLAEALEQFSSSHYPQLPVVDREDGNHLLGLLSYEELLEAYSREMMRRRQEAEPVASGGE